MIGEPLIQPASNLKRDSNLDILRDQAAGPMETPTFDWRPMVLCAQVSPVSGQAVVDDGNNTQPGMTYAVWIQNLYIVAVIEAQRLRVTMANHFDYTIREKRTHFLG